MNYRFIPVLLALRGQRHGITNTLFVYINCLQYDTMRDFSVWLRTGFNPADNVRLRNDSGSYTNLLTFSFVHIFKLY